MDRRLNPPRVWRNSSAAITAMAADESMTNHPAATAPNDNRCRLLELKEKIRTKIYDQVASELEVIGLALKGTQRVCRHPFAVTCKQVWTEFNNLVQDHPLPKIRSYVVLVKDFNFARLMSLVRKDPRLNHQEAPVARVKVYHIFTTEDMDVQPLIKWQKFAARRVGIEFVHVVGQVASLKSISYFAPDVAELAELMGDDCKETKNVCSAFRAFEERHRRAYGEDTDTLLDENDDDFGPSGSESEGEDDMMSLDEDSDGSEPDLDQKREDYAHLTHLFNR